VCDGMHRISVLQEKYDMAVEEKDEDLQVYGM
jgi:hypothetical protein